MTLTGPDSFQLRDPGETSFAPEPFRTTAASWRIWFSGPGASGQTFTQRLEGSFSSSGFTGVLTVTSKAEELRIYEELDRQPATVNGGSRRSGKAGSIVGSGSSRIVRRI